MGSNFPAAHAPATVAIVGGGFSGSLVATHLLKTATQPLTVYLIERSHELGKGVAYSTATPRHLLNVSAGNMSAFPDDPGHLLRWLNYNRNELAALLPDEINISSFIPRQVYGLYIQSILEEAAATASANVRLEYLTDEAVAVSPNDSGVTLSFKSGSQLLANKLVLAIGNAPLPTQLNGDDPQRYLRDAWSADALANLDAEATVLLIGTGLTMVDMVVSLHEQQHRGKIYAVSRRGLHPQRHRATQLYPAFLTPETAAKTARGLLRQIRAEVEAAAQQDYDWRSVIDVLRPITQQLWQQLPAVEQQRFLRHVKPYWEIHRHRIAPSIGDVLEQMMNSGQLTVTAGRIRELQSLPDGIVATVAQRKTKANAILSLSRAVNCTGIEADYRRSSQPLVASLRAQGLVRPNSIGLGFDTAASGAVLNADGSVSTVLYTLGTPRKGDLWETVAVPELRAQAQALSETLLKSLPVRVRPVPTITLSTKRIDDRAPGLETLQSTLLFRQLFDPASSTYSYLIADQYTGDAVLVDPVLEQVERDLELLNDLELTLRYCLETHLHADHITGAGQLRQQTGCRVLVPQAATVESAVKSADRTLSDGETLAVGSVVIEAIATPGHTQSHLSYLINSTHLLTGDALLIRGCGRTDFQGGDAGTLYDTVTERLFALPDETLVYPAHDYQGRTLSTIGEEKRLNPRFVVRGAAQHEYRSRSQFITIMNHLGLSYPKAMHQAIPANEYCGDFIPSDSTSLDLAADEEQQKAELALSANAEIYNSYFAMYI